MYCAREGGALEPYRSPGAALLLLVTLLQACAGKPVTAPRELLDERTGETLSVVAKPMVFARERTDVAAHARDYAALVAIEADRSGKFQEYLLLYRWSTVDPRMSAPPRPDQGELRILAGARVIDLHPLPELPVSLEQGRELKVPSHAYVVAHAYGADPALLRYLAASPELTVRMPQEFLDAPFALREDGRAALLDFLIRTQP